MRIRQLLCCLSFVKRQMLHVESCLNGLIRPINMMRTDGTLDETT